MRKRRVEECAWIMYAGAFRRACLAEDASKPVVFLVHWEQDEPRFIESTRQPTWLAKRCPHDWQMRVQLDPKPWRIYGTRWFFRCSSCDRRCDALYATRVGSPIHCRLCHNLSYESAQRWDNVKRTGRMPGVWGRMLEEVEAGGDGSAALLKTLSRR